MTTRDVVITGRGAVSAHGIGVAALDEALLSGREGIAPIRRFDTGSFSVRTGAIVPGWETPEFGAWSSEQLDVAFARAAAEEAWRDAGFQGAPPDPARVGLVNGTSFAGVEGGIPEVTAQIAALLGIEGPQLTICTACSSSTNAIGVARELLLDGTVDVVLAGGVDALFAEVFAGFHALGVLNPERCSPFSQPIGTSLGEGAGYVVLESREHATRRGHEPGLSVTGFGSSGDAYHETSSDPTGSGVSRALRGALRDAGLAPEHIGYVKAHGTGTAANDPAEWRGIQTAFGAHAASVPVSSLKASLGHAQAAAGALECIGAGLGMERDLVFPTLHFSVPRRDCPTDPVGDGQPRTRVVEHAACLNSAFGGSNAALIVSRSSGTGARRRRAVRILGTGCVTPDGTGLAGAAAEWPDRAAAVEADLHELVPSADPRGLDPASRFLTAAAALALREGKVVARGKLRDEIGLFVGMTHASTQSLVAFRDSIEERGLELLSANAFARVVLNASGGTCSKLLGLRGPHLTLSTGAGSGLVAVALAVEDLAQRRDARFMLAGGVDELPEDLPGAAPATEGAGCVLLGAEDEPGPGIYVRGWGMAGPAHPRAAVALALSRAEVGPDAIQQIWCCEPQVPRWLHDDFDGLPVTPLPAGMARAEAASGSWACMRATSALRNGKGGLALVVSQDGGSQSVALVLERKDDDGN